MPIPSYQMHNVLNVFCRRFGKPGSGFEKRYDGDRSTEEYSRQARMRRQALIDKVVIDIIAKISRSGLEPNPAELDTQPLSPVGKPEADVGAASGRFVYHVIDEQNRTVTRELSVDDSDFLLRRIDAVNTETEKDPTARLPE